MSAKKTHKPKHVPPKPRPKAAPTKPKVVPRVTVVPKYLNVHLRIHFSLPNAPGKPAWPRKSRWAGEHPVKGATITVHGRGFPATTDNQGNAKVPIAGLPGVHLLTVKPYHNWFRSMPAGPSHGSSDWERDPRYTFRPFDISVVVDSGGFSLSSPPTVFSIPSPGGPPPHAALFDVTSGSLTVDWKPDWIKAKNRDPMVSRRTKPSVPIKVNNCLVIHQTSWPERIGNVINTFLNKDAEVSAHYIIDVDGHVVKMVHESEKARHAGLWSFWQGRLGLNDCSIGIEIVHADVTKDGAAALHDFSDSQYQALERLLAELRAAYPAITRQRVVGHSDVEIEGPDGAGAIHYRMGRDRAGDPGDMFDWARLERAGLARQLLAGPPTARVYGIAPGQTVRPDEDGPHVAELQRDLAEIGYAINDDDGTTPTGRYDVATRRAVQRFRIRFFAGSRLALRPRSPGDGSLEFETAFAIRQVAEDRGS